jgi:pSer/pThr/pTyr-binding forkhead associated (FHA) protein
VPDGLVFVEQRPLAGRVVGVRPGLTFGREGCDVALIDPEVSRRHAVISVVDGASVIADLGSTNGTWLNGRRIDGPTRVGAGDVLRLGNTVFNVEDIGGPTRVAGHPSEGLSSDEPHD